MNYTDKHFWNLYYRRFKLKIVDNSLFANLFNCFLTLDPKKTVIEVGCAGSYHLCYLAKYFKYKAFGIDYIDEIETTRTLFAYNKLPEPTLYQDDFTTWNPPRQFDVVCSFGFIEHFENPSHILARHLRLLAPGGTLIVIIPHFAHLQYFFHWLIDRENLKKHNTRIMSKCALNEAIRHAERDEASFTSYDSQSRLEIKFLDYFRTFDFWIERLCHGGARHDGSIEVPLNFIERLLYRMLCLCARSITSLLGPYLPNPFVSPYLVLIAQKSSPRNI